MRVDNDEGDCIGVIFELTITRKVKVLTGSATTSDWGNGAKFWRIKGTANYVVRLRLIKISGRYLSRLSNNQEGLGK